MKKADEPVTLEIGRRYSREVEERIAASDENTHSLLDQADFDLISYVNEVFPNRAALEQISMIREKEKFLLASTNERLHTIVQNVVAHQANTSIPAPNTAMFDQVFETLSVVGAQAVECAGLITHLARRTEKLHAAKRHLKATREYFREFAVLEQMLQVAHKALEPTTDLSGAVQSNFAAALSPITASANAVGFFAAHGEDVLAIPRVRAMLNPIITDATAAARRFLFGLSARTVPEGLLAIELSDEEARQLGSAVQIVSHTSVTRLRAFVEEFLASELAPFEALFARRLKPGDPLDAEGCYNRVREYLQKKVFIYRAAFPPEWRVVDRFIVRWTRLAHAAFTRWLREKGAETAQSDVDAADARDLLAAVGATSEAVEFLEEMFWRDDDSEKLRAIFDRMNTKDVSDAVATERINAENFTRVIERWSRHSRATEAEPELGAASGTAGMMSLLDPAEDLTCDMSGGPLGHFDDTLSFRNELLPVFSNVLGIYVKDETRVMRKALSEVMSADVTADIATKVMRVANAGLEEVVRHENLGLRVPSVLIRPFQLAFNSAQKVLLIAKESSKRCAMFSTGLPFAELAGKVAHHFTTYLRHLERVVKRPLHDFRENPVHHFASLSNVAVYGSEEKKIPPMFLQPFPLTRLSPEDVALLTAVSATCVYMKDNLQMLQEQLHASAGESVRASISLEEPLKRAAELSVECFRCVISGALEEAAGVLARWRFNADAGSTTSMRGGGETAATASEYVQKAAAVLTGMLKRVRVCFGTSFGRLALEIASSSFLGLLGRAFLAQTRLTPEGAAQFAADARFAFAALERLQGAAGVRLRNAAARLRRTPGELLFAAIRVVSVTHRTSQLVPNFVEQVLKAGLAPREHAVAWFPDFARVLLDAKPAKRAAAVKEFRRRVTGKELAAIRGLVRRAERLEIDLEKRRALAQDEDEFIGSLSAIDLLKGSMA
eukprot:gnl/Chilomastix_cuspidata/1153.p1 GENE.gnl/Chilomastix_cuspidata/1153~~gnl/Chilomastix_cuspidata/1153.p1  ORF type:complete len:954 (+),score=217.96 gnl/Chilomastix_cuspidata/1153:28-2889(+)